jgi:predicted amidophosphoribosyltransferase
MEPSTSPGIQPRQRTTCIDCGEPLDGNQWRCPRCVEAAQVACREITGRPILPSDIDAIRARLG